MSRSVAFNQKVRQVKGMLFVHTLASEVGVPHTGRDLRSWWEDMHPRLPGQRFIRKWESFLEGSLPNQPLRGQLVRTVPLLGDVLNTPLWFALSDVPCGKAIWDNCAMAIRMDGAPLGSYESKLMDCFCGSPQWLRLGYLIILLRSRTPRFLLQRLWLRNNFRAYFCLVCAQYPFGYISEGVFRVVDALNRRGELGGEPLSDWPSSEESFLQSVDDLRWLAGLLVRFGWVRGLEDAYLLIWIVLGRFDPFALLLVYVLMLVGEKFPDNDRMLLARSKKKYSGVMVDLDLSTIECSLGKRFTRRYFPPPV